MISFIESKIAPNPTVYDYWVDLTTDPYKGIIRHFNGKEWVATNSNAEHILEIEKAIADLKENKVDKVPGKQLSTEDYTTAEKQKLAGIEDNANNYTLPTASADTKGGITLGYTENAKNYAVKLDGKGKAFVTVTWLDADNTLTSDSITIPLAAAQGKVLKGLYDALNQKYAALEARVKALENPVP